MKTPVLIHEEDDEQQEEEQKHTGIFAPEAHSVEQDNQKKEEHQDAVTAAISEKVTHYI